MKLAKGHVTIGLLTRFGPTWPGQRCLAKTRRGTPCQRAAHKHVGRCALHGGLSTGARTEEGRARLAAARTTHGKYTKKKRAIAKQRAEVGRRVRGELRRIENQLKNSGLLPDGY
jgi:hypothetical protein